MAPAYHPRVEALIRDLLAWPALRPVQQQAAAPIVAGQHTLIMAATAGGKTEAAAFAWLSRALANSAAPSAAIWICPTRALATQLFERLDALCSAVGFTAHLRHSDVDAADRARWEREPGELLVTTRESFVGLLLAVREAGDRADGRRAEDRDDGRPRRAAHTYRGAWAERLGTVIVDETHVFAAGSRGVHLMSLIARLDNTLGRTIQRIGLSATIANPDEVWEWFTGAEAAQRCVVAVPAEPRDRELWLDAFDDDESRADALAATVHGRRALVFCNSRRLVDQTAHALNERGVAARAHHGTIAAESRQDAEEALREGDPLALVCTSTLELGIDVGHLDTVVQLDAPPSVAGFVQRIGRAARRPGQIAHVWLLTVGRNQTRRAWAVVSLAMERWMEPIERPDGTDVLWHQILAMTVADGFDAARIRSVLNGVSLWRDLDAAAFATTVNEMIAADWLARSDGAIVAGEFAQRRFGARNWSGLCATFGDGRRPSTLEHDGSPLGTIDARVAVGETLWMDGRPWRVSAVEGERVSVVAATDGDGAKSHGWRGAGTRHHARVLERAEAGCAARPEWVGDGAWEVIS